MPQVTIEFPILVYMDDGQCVAHSLITGTVAVGNTSKAAREEVCELLEGEIQDALEQSKGDLRAALDCLQSPTPGWMVQAFFVSSMHLDDLKPRHVSTGGRRDAPKFLFPVREMNAPPAAIA